VYRNKDNEISFSYLKISRETNILLGVCDTYDLNSYVPMPKM
jgi:hypothetical protein